MASKLQIEVLQQINDEQWCDSDDDCLDNDQDEILMTSEDEMKAFYAMQVSMGLIRLPLLHDYWSTNPLIGTPGIVKGMSRNNRFRSILSHLQLNDNSRMPQPGSPEFDKLYQVRLLLDRILANSQAAYQPHQQIAVDEAMVLLKGRSAMHQYMHKNH